MTVPGYSGKSLAQKLGLRAGMTLELIEAPAEYLDWLGPVPAGLQIAVYQPSKNAQAIHLFSTRKSLLLEWLIALRPAIKPDGFVWVSWPKKASKTATDITEDVIRGLALPLGFVDVKVCAVSDVWSGLKLVIRKSERP